MSLFSAARTALRTASSSSSSSTASSLRAANLVARRANGFARGVGSGSSSSKGYATHAAGDNAWLAERAHAKEHAGKSADLWRKVSLFVCIPGSIVIAVYIYQIEAEHIHHRDHEIEENDGELPERTQYEYTNIRKKAFPWGSQSIFWNPKANVKVEAI